MNNIDFRSYKDIESKSMPGVTFRIRKMTMGGRIELSLRVRELSQRSEFLQAGGNTDRIENNMLERALHRIFIEWGLVEVKGLTIEGMNATAFNLPEFGPEDLCDEIVQAIQEEIALSAAERKN